MTIWNEADHPRDNEGKFTYKGGNTSSSKHEEKMRNRADILYPTMKEKNSKENYNNEYHNNIGLGNYQNDKLSREDILYPSMKNKKEDGVYTGGSANLENSISNYNQPYKEYVKNLNEINLAERYKNNQEIFLKKSIVDKSIQTAPKWDSSYNAKFSDSELQEARNFIQGEEKFRADAYKPTPNDKWTIGYGHTGLVDGKPITEGMKITKEKAEELYRKEFERHTAGLKNIQVPLTSNQKIALSSFMYNLGPYILNNKDSNLVRKLNAGDIQGAANELETYNKQKGKVLDGLVRRRKKEKELFLKQDRE